MLAKSQKKVERKKMPAKNRKMLKYIKNELKTKNRI